MALTGKEIVRVVGLINNGPAATAEFVTTQNVANLRNGSPSALNAGAVIYCYGVSGGNIPSSVQFATTAGAISALGSIAPSTLVGTEIIQTGPAVIGQSPAAIRLPTTTLAVANT